MNTKPIEIIKKFEDKKGKGSISLEAWIQGYLETWALEENMKIMRDVNDEFNFIYSQVKITFEDYDQSKNKSISDRDYKKDILTVRNFIHKMKIKMTAKEYVGGQFRRMVNDENDDTINKDLLFSDDGQTMNNLNDFNEEFNISKLGIESKMTSIEDLQKNRDI